MIYSKLDFEYTSSNVIKIFLTMDQNIIIQQNQHYT